MAEWVHVCYATNVTIRTGETLVRDMMVNGAPEEVSGDE